MKTKTTITPLQEILSFLFILYYGYTGFSKLYDYHLFLTLSSFQPYLGQLPVPLKWLFPFSELAIAGLLLFPATRKPAFYCVVAFLLFVIFYRLILFIKGVHLPCLCGPWIRKLNETRHLVFSTVLLAGALLSILLMRSKTNPSL
jgi:hypothetical protein